MPTKQFHIRITQEEKEKLDFLAIALGYSYGGNSSLSQFMQAIANNKIVIQKKDP